MGYYHWNHDHGRRDDLASILIQPSPDVRRPYRSWVSLLLGRNVSAYIQTEAKKNTLCLHRVGNGINTTAAPIWQTETSKAQWRGKLVILEMMMNIAGFSLVNWINYGLSFRGGSIAWRFPLAFQFIFIFILWGTVPWLPESPR